MMTQRFSERARQVLLKSGAITDNERFVYDSGEHGTGWIDKDAVAEQDAGASDGPVRVPFVLRRGFDGIVTGKRVLVVDDVISTGLSTRQTADLEVDDARRLLEVEVPSWPAVCLLCT